MQKYLKSPEDMSLREWKGLHWRGWQEEMKKGNGCNYFNFNI